MDNKTLIIGGEHVMQLLDMGECISLMEQMLRDTSSGQVRVLQREMLPHSNGNLLALMPATIDSTHIGGSKVIIFPGPEARKNNTAQGIIPLFDTTTGALKAVVDGERITTIRTAATSAAATKILSREDSSVLGILGAGKLGKSHLEAISLVRPIKTVYIWDRKPEAVARYIEEMSKKFPDIKIIGCSTIEEAAENADIICTVTKASEPILYAKSVKAGTHINAVGACSPKAREMASDIVINSRLFVDLREASLRDAGDLVIAINRGDITPEHIIAEVGEVLLGQSKGRLSDDEITMFETVGISAQDIASANLVFEKAAKAGKGTWVKF